ncbi:hypothetical protein niasHS_010380 [Heterodera schachtii]|uniref:Uncharacterized protein n=1 Tax=Heterodera schachtii TaxID=97005 RepID=A0ABD2J156_HETSC
MLLPTMAPKCLPLELLFEFVPFIPAENATPNALSSCWLLHKLLLPRVIKWKERNTLEDYSITFPVDEPSNDEYTFKIVAFDVRGEELFTLPSVTGRLLP